MMLLLTLLLLLQDDPNAKVKEVLKSECALDFKDKKLSEALMQFSEVQTVCFAVDPRSVPNATTLVCKATKEGKVEEVLKELLAPFRLTYAVWENSIIVCTAAAAKEFDGGKVPVIGAKERATKDSPAWKKEIFDLLEKPVGIDLMATIRFGKKDKTTFATAYQWLGEQTGLKISIDATGACAAESGFQVTNATGAVALALISRACGCAAVMEQGKTIRIKK
jgi:hypothetical protein